MKSFPLTPQMLDVAPRIIWFEAPERAPAGIIDPRSWAYWNSKLGRYPPPPLPKRHFGETAANC